jgi:hypothetical protein
MPKEQINGREPNLQVAGQRSNTPDKTMRRICSPSRNANPARGSRMRQRSAEYDKTGEADLRLFPPQRVGDGQRRRLWPLLLLSLLSRSRVAIRAHPIHLDQIQPALASANAPSATVKRVKNGPRPMLDGQQISAVPILVATLLGWAPRGEDSGKGVPGSRRTPTPDWLRPLMPIGRGFSSGRRLDLYDHF